jgi:tetratricopeptide (TPR) repeat protein
VGRTSDESHTPQMKVESSRYRLRAVVLALVMVMTLSCSETPMRPDIVMISLDTVRLDSFLAVAESESTLQKLLAGSRRFAAAVSPTPLTLPAHTSLMSGWNPNRHGVRNNGQRVGSDVPLIAEVLQQQGYQTGAFVSAFPLDRQFGLQRGFDHFDQPEPDSASRAEFVTLERPAPATIQRAIDWIDDQVSPAFLWVHLFDAHAPYTAPVGSEESSRRARYEAEIRAIGAALKPLVERIESRQRPFVLVLLADHGEGLGDHGELDHGLLLYDSTLLVPMLWYAPDRWSPGISDQTARLVDVVPTLLDLLDAEPDALDLDGVSLLPSLRGEKQTVPAAYAETYYPTFAYRRMPLRSVREQGWKFIGSETGGALHHVQADPREEKDLALIHPQRFDRMQFDAWQRPEPIDANQQSHPISKELQGLGYLASVAAGPPSGEVAEVIESHRRLVLLQEQLTEGHVDEALKQAQELVTDEPENAFAMYVAGVLWLDRGRRDEAIRLLDLSLSLDPNNTQTRFKLAEALMASARHDQALAHWQVLETSDPDRIAVWINEAAALAALGNWQDAEIAISEALRRRPDDLIALDNAAAIAEKLGQWEQAANHLVRLSVADPRFDQFGRAALFWIRAGNEREALGIASRAPQSASDYDLVLLAEAVAFARLGDSGSALSRRDALRRRNPRLFALAAKQFAELQ